MKLVFVNELVSRSFLEKLQEKISDCKAGLPWTSGALITPMPEPGKMDHLLSLVEDALTKGAAIINAENGGGRVYGNIFIPAIISPVNHDMRLWHEEQLGPVRYWI